MTQPAAAVAADAIREVRQEEVERPAPKFEQPITPLVRSEPARGAGAGHPFEREATPVMPSELEFQALMKMAEMLASSGFLPRKLDTPGKVLAVILTGREMGFPPMLSTRAIRIQEKTGYPIVLADALLGNFKSRGGRAQFVELTETRGVLYLRHPNGDEHTETFTIEMAKKAGLLEARGQNNEPNNWLKWPKAMIRSRCITAGLKSVGWEAAAAAYDADEAQEIAQSIGIPTSITAEVSASGEVRPKEEERRAHDGGLPIKLRGKFLDEKDEGGQYALPDGVLRHNYDWALDKATVARDAKNEKEEKKFNRLADAITAELKRREQDREPEPEIFKPGLSVGEAFEGIGDYERDGAARDLLADRAAGRER